jgi:hypothetical protein
LEKDTMATTDIDLLLNLDTGSQAESQSDRSHLDDAAQEGLVTTQDNFKGLLNDSEETQHLEASVIIEQTEKENHNGNINPLLASSNSILKAESSIERNTGEKTSHEDLLDMKRIEQSRENISNLGPTIPQKVRISCYFKMLF